MPNEPCGDAALDGLREIALALLDAVAALLRERSVGIEPVATSSGGVYFLGEATSA